MKEDERATGGGKRGPINRARKHAVGILISCLGLITVVSYLIGELLEYGSLKGLLQHLTKPSMIFYHTTVFLSIPAFTLIGYFYQKQQNLAENLEEKVEERTRELKETQQQLLKAERMAAIGEAAGMVGHDLRNPLQAIVNALYLAKETFKNMTSPYGKLAEEKGIEELLATIGEEVRYMNKIVSDLQDYARPVKPKSVPTSLPQLINDALSTITVPETVKVSKVIPEDFPKLMVDPALMKRVFTNLILNAVQAMPDGGQLTIKSSKIGETAFISVQDTGVGIPEEDLPKLFRPLFTTKSKGQGFGLPVCKRLVEVHDGTITVESKVGRGSTFTVKIPLRREVS